MYDPEFLTDRPERFFVSELIREAAMLNTRQEVPYGIACELDRYEEDGKLVRIEGTLIVEKPSHKAIVIGNRGETIKKISTRAREEIEALLERKVYLRLWVKVVPGWTREAEDGTVTGRCIDPGMAPEDAPRFCGILQIDHARRCADDILDETSAIRIGFHRDE